MAIKAVVHVPSETITDDTVLIGNLFVATGSLVEAGARICEMETSKSIMEIESPSSGYIAVNCVEAQEMKPGDVLAIIYDTLEEAHKAKGTSKTAAEQEGRPATLPDAPAAGRETALAATERKKTQFSDEAIALIRQFGLSTDIFSDRTFVRKQDVIDKAGGEKAAQRAGGTTAEAREKIPTNTDIIPARPLKTAEIRNLQNGQNAITSTFVSKIRLPDPALENKSGSFFRNLRNDLTALIVLRTARLLKKHRELNAFYHDNAVHFYRDVNIGYAIDLNKGLRVVNLGNIEGATTDEINGKLIDFAKSYLQDGISIKDLQGSTFTITDLSSEDVLFFSPMINKFQSAILGISSVDEYDGSFLLSLVVDHRVTEGKKAAQFLKELKKTLTEDLSKNRVNDRTRDKE